MRITILLLLFVLPLAERISGQAKEPVIDVHLHAYNLWKVQPDTAWYPKHFARPATSEALMKQSVQMMKKYNVVKAIASGDLATVKQWQAYAPGLLIPGYETWEPFTPEHIERLTQQIKLGDVKVLAEIVTQYDGIGASDSALEPLYTLAEAYDIPVGIHMGPGPAGIAYNAGYRSRLSSPLLLEEALVHHPRLRIYIMHAGWPMLDDMVAMLYGYPNLYVDVAVIDWYIPRAEFNSYLKRLVDAGFSNRIMFGSDQMQWPQTIGAAIDAIQSADFLTKQQKRDILYNNAMRFFRLENKK